MAAPPLPPKVRWANFYYTRLQYLIAVIVTCCFYVVLGLSSWDMSLKLSAVECKESRDAVDFLYVLAICSTVVIILCEGMSLAMENCNGATALVADGCRLPCAATTTTSPTRQSTWCSLAFSCGGMRVLACAKAIWFWVNCCPRSTARAAADVIANVVLGPRYNNTAVVGRQQSALAVCFITLMLGYTIFNVCGGRMIADHSVPAAWLAPSAL
jgi:hypothetical protein